MNLIKDRDARTKKRQKAKAKFDKNITLSASPLETTKRAALALSRSEGKVRLLDEGSIVTADNDIDLYIKKGTIRKYASGKNKKLTPRYLYGDIADEYFENPDEPLNLDDSYEGTINIGHQRFATFPFIVGTWKQEDLSLTDNGDGRKGLDVELKLNEAHPLVQALRVQGIPVGVSVEMYLHLDDKATEEESEKMKRFVPIVDEIFIADFAIVGECGNVGSSGSVDLQGVKMENNVKDTELEEVFEDIDRDDMLEEIAEENEMGVEDTTEETEESEAEEKETEVEEEAEEEVETEESVEEEVIEEAESEEDEIEEDALAVAEETINTLKAENQALKEQIEALKKSNNKKEKKIKEYAEKNAQAAEKFKNLSVSIGLTKEVKETVSHVRYATGDGIGE